MKIYTEESRVFYSDAFDHPIKVTAIGGTSLAGLHVRAVLKAPPLENAESEARRALRLVSWLALTGHVWPPVVAVGPMEFPHPRRFPWQEWTRPKEAFRIAVDAAGCATQGEMVGVVSDALRGRHLRMHVEEVVERGPEGLDEAIRSLSIPIACSPLRDMTIGEAFDAIRSLHLVRRLVPGAVYTAAGVQAANAFFDGDIMLALGFAAGGTLATLLLHVAHPAETFSGVIARELELSGSTPALPDEPPPALPAPNEGEDTTG